jgi:hypothetical protein
MLSADAEASFFMPLFPLCLLVLASGDTLDCSCFIVSTEILLVCERDLIETDRELDSEIAIVACQICERSKKKMVRTFFYLVPT